MDEDKTAYHGSERRKTQNAKFRCQLSRVGEDLADTPRITQEEMAQLFELAREYCQRAGGRGSQKVFRMIREERADELSPALLALLEDLLS